ncbi:MAG: hypothetical protein Q9M92_15135 [Enterobacterales bacterium]|nr:hypothetical protein [Enterobacterales bacterium]
MKKVKVLIMLSSVFSLASCTYHDWYGALQSNQQHKCRNLPPSAYDECINQSSETYSEYLKKRRQVLEEKKTKEKQKNKS